MSRQKKEVLKWTKECLHCKRLYKCKGRASNEPCLNYEEREENGYKKNVYDEDM